MGYLPPGPPAVRDGVPPPVVVGARDLLLEQGVAWCVAETDDKDPAPEDLSWEPAGYLRLRKTEYSDEELGVWAARMREALDAGADIFCYFKHEDEGASTQMAKRLQGMVRPPLSQHMAPPA